MLEEDKATQYRRMLAYLESLGANLGPHASARLATVQTANIEDMDQYDLLHYQRVLEATIDNRHELMDKTALKQELAAVVRERIARGYVQDKVAETQEFRQRQASLQ